jgi:hypothetical protein
MTQRDIKRIRGAALIGRRIGIALFWCLAVFVVVASTNSVLSQLYDWPTPRSLAFDEARCANEIRALEHALLVRAGEELRARRDPQRLHRWLTNWDKRFGTLRGHCGSLEDARASLASLRQNVEQMLHEHRREHLLLIERIDRALERFSTRSRQET